MSDNKELASWRKLDVEKLTAEILKLRRKQFNFRMQAASSQDSIRSHEITKTRKDIARLKTIINEKQASQAASS